MKEYIYLADELIKNKPPKLEGLNEVKKINVNNKILDVMGYDIIYDEINHIPSMLVRFFSKNNFRKTDMIGYVSVHGNNKLIVRDGDVIIKDGIKEPYDWKLNKI